MRNTPKRAKKNGKGEKCAVLKIFGLLFVSFSVFIYGYAKSCAIKRKNDAEDGFLMLLSHIQAQLSSSALPLDEIYKSFHNDALLSQGFIFTLCESKHDALYNAMQKKGGEILKNKKLFSLMLDFSQKIGSSPSAHEGQRLCESFIALYREEIASSRQKDKTKAELYKKMSFVCAVFIFLMFI